MGWSKYTVEGGIAVVESPPNKNASQKIFYSGVVREFISNPADLSDSKKQDIENNVVSGDKYVSRMPRNSIIVEIIGNSQIRVCYPFFSPHICMPVKPGEQVWVLFPDGGVGELGYWVTRKATDLKVDDLNYTHLDRVGLFNKSKETTEKSDFQDENGETSFPFPLGPSIDSLENTLGGSEPYRILKVNSEAYHEQFTGEPVARFTKRCPDLVLQGSNNTLISLGEDRGVSSADSEAGSVSTDVTLKGKGTIDIVTGRGIAGTSTAAVAEGKARQGEGLETYSEINKIPEATDVGKDKVNEGDPDFNNDLSRIYLSMNTNGDDNFSLTYPDSIGSVTSKPYAIVKSDEVRLVARETGSVRIIKEGSNKAVITMLSDGKILIDSSNVMIGAGATEPIVLGNVLVKSLVDLIGQIIDQINLISVPTGVGPSGPPANAAAFSGIKATLQTSLDACKSGIGTIK